MKKILMLVAVLGSSTIHAQVPGAPSGSMWTCQLSGCKNKLVESYTGINALTPTKDQSDANKICKEKLNNLDDQTVQSFGAFAGIGLMRAKPSKTESKLFNEMFAKLNKEAYQNCKLTGQMIATYNDSSLVTQTGLEIPLRACEMTCTLNLGGGDNLFVMDLFAISETDADAQVQCKDKLKMLQSGKISARKIRKQGQLLVALGLDPEVATALPQAFTNSEMRYLKQKMKHLYDGCTTNAVEFNPLPMGRQKGAVYGKPGMMMNPSPNNNYYGI